MGPGLCYECKFWQAKKDHMTGWCRRYAPQPRVDGNAVDAVWPKTQNDDYCGDWAWRE